MKLAFPKIFQNGLGCPTERDPDLPWKDYCVHIMMCSPNAMRHPTFGYFAYNSWMRSHAHRGQTKWMMRQAADFPVDELRPQKLKQVMGKLVRLTSDIPGTAGHKFKEKRQLDCMRQQIDQETSQLPNLNILGTKFGFAAESDPHFEKDAPKLGQSACLFTTMTSCINKNDQLSRWIRRWNGLPPEAPPGETLEEKIKRQFQETKEHALIVLRTRCTIAWHLISF